MCRETHREFGPIFPEPLIRVSVLIGSFGCDNDGPTTPGVIPGPIASNVTFSGGATLPQVADWGASDSAAPTIQIHAEPTCSWTVANPTHWLSPSPTSGTGNGTVRVTVGRNTTPYARTGNVAVNGQNVTVSQVAGQIPNLEPILGEVPECNYDTLTPNWGEEVSILTDYRFRQWMNDQPIRTWIDPWFDSKGIGGAVRRGLESWGAGTGGARLGRLEYTDDRAVAHLVVAPADFIFPPQLGEGHVYGNGVTTSEATIYFTSYFFDRCGDLFPCDTLAQITAAHKMGHALTGILGHPTRTDSIMYTTRIDEMPLSPTQTDLNTMRTAYGCR